MTAYMILKHLHMTAAYLTITLFALRLLLDVVGRPGWRETPLRWIPHANDTVLLVAAIALLFVAGYASSMPGWLIAKIVLLVGYIVAGVFANKAKVSTPGRVIAAHPSLVPGSGLFPLAKAKAVAG